MTTYLLYESAAGIQAVFGVELTLLARQLRLCFVSQERVRRDSRNRGGGGVGVAEQPCAPSTANFCFQQVQNSLLDPKKVSKIVSLHAWTQFLGRFGYIRHACYPGATYGPLTQPPPPPAGFPHINGNDKQEHRTQQDAHPAFNSFLHHLPVAASALCKPTL